MITENLEAEKHRYKATQVIKFINIASGQDNSGIQDFYGVQIRKLLFPSNWTSCNISFSTSSGQNVNGSYDNFLDTNFDGSPLLIATIPSQSLPIVPGYFDANKYFQLNCSVAQSQDVRIIALLQPIYQGIHA